MTFKVFFRAEKNHAVAIPKRKIGISHLDLARTLKGGEKLSPEQLYHGIDQFYEDVTISIDEKTARECGHFQEKSEIQVDVNNGELNQFTELQLFPTGNTGMELRWVPCSCKIREYWKNTGYALDLVTKKQTEG